MTKLELFLKRTFTDKRGKAKIGLIIISVFGAFFLFVFALGGILYVTMYDSFQETDRIHEQLIDNEYLEQNIDNYCFINISEVYKNRTCRTKDQVYEVYQMSICGPRYALIEVWFKPKTQNWKMDSINVIEVSDKYIQRVWEKVKKRPCDE